MGLSSHVRHSPLSSVVVAILLAALVGCNRGSGVSAAAPTAAAVVPNYTYEVVHAWPHDRAAFTEGLVFLHGHFLESTGLTGQSTLREVDLKTGAVLRQVSIPAQYFGEGLTVLGDRVFQLTWQTKKGFVYDLTSFRLEKEFAFEGEGWGLTTDGQSLIMSNGTSQIQFLDPNTFQVTRTIRVLYEGQPVENLNELEYIRGEIFANVWMKDHIVRIDPATGVVVGDINFAGLLPREDSAKADVLNGIAYDAADDRLFVTGKLWPKVFEVRLKAIP